MKVFIDRYFGTEYTGKEYGKGIHYEFFSAVSNYGGSIFLEIHFSPVISAPLSFCHIYNIGNGGFFSAAAAAENKRLIQEYDEERKVKEYEEEWEEHWKDYRDNTLQDNTSMELQELASSIIQELFNRGSITRIDGIIDNAKDKRTLLNSLIMTGERSME